MIGVVVPAHNEEAFLDGCLQALVRAAACPALGGEPVRIVVVLDACTDRSLAVASAYPVMRVAIAARNVGQARGVGAAELLAQGARWLAFTDADSVVSDTWLADQLSLGMDAVCGCVSVEDWSEHAPAVRQRYDASYQHRDGHSHVHGANLGVSAAAYRAAGGFPALGLSEDVALVHSLLAIGANVAWSALPRVATSARRAARALGGFAGFLIDLAQDDDLAA